MKYFFSLKNIDFIYIDFKQKVSFRYSGYAFRSSGLRGNTDFSAMVTTGFLRNNPFERQESNFHLPAKKRNRLQF